jgi:hypothetical protein
MCFAASLVTAPSTEESTACQNDTLTGNGGTGISGSGFNGGTAKIIATRNTIALNATGMDGNGSTFNSAGDNAVNGNGTDVTGPINLFSWQ